MRLTSLSLSAIALLAGIGIATAQQAPPPADQAKPAQAGAEEPSSRTNAATPAPAEVLVDGRLTVPGAPQDSQTVPSKFSERNAKLDEEPLVKQPTR